MHQNTMIVAFNNTLRNFNQAQSFIKNLIVLVDTSGNPFRLWVMIVLRDRTHAGSTRAEEVPT